MLLEWKHLSCVRHINEVVVVIFIGGEPRRHVGSVIFSVVSERLHVAWGDVWIFLHVMVTLVVWLEWWRLCLICTGIWLPRRLARCKRAGRLVMFIARDPAPGLLSRFTSTLWVLYSVYARDHGVPSETWKRSAWPDYGTEIKPVCVSLALNFGQYVLVIVVTQSSAEFVVVHVGFVFTDAPLGGDAIRVGDSELTERSLPSCTTLTDVCG